MRICIIGKYPPIHGGVSAQTYWLARGLASRGHEVHVVTNAGEVEDNFRVLLEEEDRELYEPRFEQGFVRVWNTEPFGPRYRHIPQSNPFVTKLASLATEVAHSVSPDIIFSFYLEPYAVAAYLVSSWTGIPFIVRHAGSDVGRLITIDQLKGCYREIVRRASLVATGERYAGLFYSLGVPSDRIYLNQVFSPNRDFFNPGAMPFDINAFLSRKSTGRFVSQVLKWHTDSIDTSLPTIGIYGKIGEVKGTYDLISSLSMIKGQGLRFNLVALAAGWPKDCRRFRRLLAESNLRDETRILPGLPAWRIPSFLTAMDAVCFLERDFPIKTHSPLIPQEVMACGTALLVSSGIALKQIFSPNLMHDINSFIVRDPRDHKELESLLIGIILAPDRARAVGGRGAVLAARFQNHEEWLRSCEKMLHIALSRKAPGCHMMVHETGSPAFLRLQRLFPLTLKLCESVGKRFVEDIMQGCDEREDDRAYAAGIFESLSRVIEPDMSESPLMEMAKWEMHRAPLESDRLMSTAAGMLFRAFEGEVESLSPGSMMKLIPVKTECCTCDEFRYDMEKLTVRVREGNAHQVEPENTWYTFLHAPSLSRPLTRRIDPGVFHFLNACNGERKAADIIEEICAGSGGEAATGKWAASMLHLFLEGLICFSESSGNSNWEDRQ